LLAVIAGCVAYILVRTVRRTTDTLLVVALSLVLGGAIGNLIDRVFRAPGFLHGAVIDFVDIGRWPTFNVADSAITIGAVLVVVWSMRSTARERHA
jgi:signal peptidase II